MAKGNYSNVYATDQTTAPDWSNWLTQQEKLNQQQEQWNLQLKKDEEKAKETKDTKLRSDLEKSGYGKRTKFDYTGTEALDYNIYQVALIAEKENFEIDKQIKELLEKGNYSVFDLAELQYKKEQILNLPENLKAGHMAFQKEVDDFNSGKYIKTEENQKRLKRLHDGEYQITLDPDNKGQFLVVFDEDGDGKLDYIPMNEFMSGKSIGKKILNVDMLSAANETAGIIGKLKTEGVSSNKYYTIEREGIKYNDKELLELIKNQALFNPDYADSFAYQAFRKTWDELTPDEKDKVSQKYLAQVKISIDETHKTKFNSPLANYELNVRKQNETERKNKVEEKRKDKEGKLNGFYTIDNSGNRTAFSVPVQDKKTVEDEPVTGMELYPGKKGVSARVIIEGGKKIDIKPSEISNYLKLGENETYQDYINAALDIGAKSDEPVFVGENKYE